MPHPFDPVPKLEPAVPAGAAASYLSEVHRQAALLQTGALQSAIFNSANFSSIATDAQGVIQIFNVGAARMLGYEAADVMNKITPAEISDPAELIERAQALSLELATPIAPGFEALSFKAARGIEDIYELTYIRMDGSRLPAMVSVTALRDAQDKIIGYLLIGTDNTARKLLADELTRHRDRLEELVAARTAELAESRDAALAATQAKTIFLANMSHEIRTPMNAILGLSHLALQTALDDKPRQHLEKIRGAADNLLAIINGILDFSKAEAGQMQLEHQRFVLADVLARVGDIATLQAEAKGLAFRLELGAEVPQRLIGDGMRLGQVLLNLCTNAVRFTDQGSVCLQVALVGQHSSNIELQFQVEDTGEGVAKDKHALIFEQFMQADASTTRTHGGSGLGLTISRQLVELMGGQLGLTSRLGAGSTFHFNAHFGVAPASDTATQARAESAPVGSSQAVQQALRGAMIVCEVLSGAGAQVLLASDGRQAVALLSAHPDVDLVLMDCHMPEMDGYTATRAIRADGRFAALPVLALTASLFPDDLLACVAAGMNAHIEKPFAVDRLLEVLAHWLTRHRLPAS
jgi:signal transduction histidine kinase/CheY-like chemotaxis protein